MGLHTGGEFPGIKYNESSPTVSYTLLDIGNLILGIRDQHNNTHQGELKSLGNKPYAPSSSNRVLNLVDDVRHGVPGVEPWPHVYKFVLSTDRCDQEASGLHASQRHG